MFDLSKTVACPSEADDVNLQNSRSRCIFWAAELIRRIPYQDSRGAEIVGHDIVFDELTAQLGHSHPVAD